MHEAMHPLLMELLGPGPNMNNSVVIVDDYASIRQLLAAFIESRKEFTVAGQAGNGVEGLNIIKKLHPDVAILDLILPRFSGHDVLKRVKKEAPNTKVLLYTGITDEAFIARVLEERPHGFVGKRDPLETVYTALKTVASGQVFFTQFASRLLVSCFPDQEYALSSREREILQLVSDGKSSKEVASILEISTRTVENHRAHMIEKLRVKSVAQLVKIALRSGWIV